MADCTVAPSSAEELLEWLRQYRLLSTARLTELADTARKTEPRVLAQMLLERGWLTHYQLNLLFQGRGAELLIDPYLILSRLGEGGGGLVLKARHLRMQRIVAIKLIRKSLLTDPDIVARFQREIEVASQVSHANVVHAYDAGPMQGTLGLVMEYVEGTDLAKLIKDEGPLPVARGCDYIRQAALGMQHVHEKGLIHRDIKPSNLLVTLPREGEAGFGTVKVLDLGLARLSGHKAQTASSQLTTMGSVMMGTPDYMAPEQAIDLRNADIRADVYSMGCTLFFLLTGQPPFPAGTLAQKLLKHQAAPVPSIRQVRAELPPALDRILGKMLAKDPAQRYQTPAEVAEALAPLAASNRRTAVRKQIGSTWNGDRTLTLPPDIVGKKKATKIPTTILRKRRWLWLAGAGAGALVLFSVLAMSLVMAFSGSKDEAKARTGGSTTERPPVAAPRTLDAMTALGDPRGRYWGSASAMAWSPNSKLVAVAVHGNVHVWDGTTLADVRTLEVRVPEGRSMGMGRQINALAISPDGQRLASCQPATGMQGGEVKIWDLTTGAELKSWTHSGFVGVGAAFSLDGETINIVNNRSTPPPGGQVIDFRCWEAATGKEKRPAIESPSSMNGRLSPTGAFGICNTTTAWKYWDLTKGSVEIEAPLQANRGMPLTALSADGLTLLLTSQNPTIVNGVFSFEVQLANLGPLAPDTPVANRIQTHTISDEYGANLIAPGPRPQTLFLWGRSLDGSKGAIRLWDLNGTPKRLALFPLPAHIATLSLSPDGKTLAAASGDGNLRLWDAATLNERYPDSGHRGQPHLLAFADNDQILYTASLTDHTVRVWDQGRGKEKARLTIGTGQNVNLNPTYGLQFAHGADAPGLVMWNSQGIFSLDGPTAKPRELLSGPSTNVQTLTVSPDGRTIAMIAANTLKFLDTATGAPRSTVVPNIIPFNNHLSFSHDGKLLGLATQVVENGRVGWTIRVLDVATGNDRLSVAGAYTYISSFAFSGDGRYLAACGQRHEGNKFFQDWKVWEVASGKERTLSPAPPANMSANLIFSPTGSTLVSWTQQRLDVWDMVTGKAKAQIAFPAQAGVGKASGVRAVAISRDGQRVAYSLHDHRLVLFDLATASNVQEWKVQGVAFMMAISSNGRQVAVANSNGLINVYRQPGTTAPN
ncbi:MAG: protein kinase [Gemmataceae bacterium]|nr:protein kinase [Gemmataceae bacterium]